MMRGVLIALALLAPAAVQAQGPTPPTPARDMAAVVQRHSQPMAFSETEITGPGAEALLKDAASAQFFIVNEVESHIDEQTPLFTAGLLTTLQRSHGFNYVALEQDPFGMEVASAAPVRGRLDRLVAWARRYPWSFTFFTDQELRMLARAGAVSRGRSAPVWGVDQVIGATYPLTLLRPLAPNAEAAAAADALLAEFRAAETLRPDGGHWSGTRDYAGQIMSKRAAENRAKFRRLKALYAPRPGGRAERLLDALIRSSEIYAYFSSKELGPQGEPVAYYNVAVREALMKQQFLAEYRRAERADGRLPKVVLKAGVWHGGTGLGRGAVLTLGNFLHEFAIANGKQAISVSLLPTTGWTSETIPPRYRPLLPSRRLDAVTLVDLRALRPNWADGERFGLSDDPQALAEFRRFIFEADYALFFPSRRGSYRLTDTPSSASNSSISRSSRAQPWAQNALSRGSRPKGASAST